MEQNLTVLVERLKKGVVERCRERVISAAEKKRTGFQTLSHTSRHRGLLRS